MVPRSVVRVLRWLLVLALVGAALWKLGDSLPSIATALRATHPHWALVALASVVTLGAYGLLIESWRRTLECLGGTLRPFDAAVIWLGSNLARYLPGFGWQIGLMGAMAKDRGVGIAVTTASSALVSIVNVLTGLAVCLAGLALLTVGPNAVPTMNASALAVVVLGVLALAASPWILPRIGRLASRVTGRDVALPRISMRAALIAGGGTAIAWTAYGVAFWLLARAVLPDTGQRTLASCITLYTLQYLVGQFTPMPAGIGVTEPVIILLAPQFGLATTAEATVLALFVRAWRTVMETVPNLIVLGLASLRHRDGAAGGDVAA